MIESKNTVERTLSILETVAHSTSGLTNSDISRRLKLPKSSASYILRILENRGYLTRETNSGKYRLGLKLMGLTRESATHTDIREVAKPIMESFVKRTSLSTHLAVLDNGRAVYVEKVENPNSFIKMDIWVGHRLPVHSTAIGKVLVSNMTEEDVVAILELRGMEKKAPRTITNPKRYLKELEKVRTYGFALDNEENSPGVRCIASPVFDAQGKIVAALGTSDTIIRLDESHLPKIVELVKKAANQISNLIGYDKTI
ncbi:MAG: IclR family transcriptional regulator [Acidobacteria bacterium]|nr:IclR family transcriptional regulator [Acidobacteriota bacterium]